jgi:hypothetical protein
MGDASQFAFLRGRSTVQPAMIKRLLLERAKHHGLPVAAAGLDWMKAYDSSVPALHPWSRSDARASGCWSRSRLGAGIGAGAASGGAAPEHCFRGGRSSGYWVPALTFQFFFYGRDFSSGLETARGLHKLFLVASWSLACFRFAPCSSFFTSRACGPIWLPLRRVRGPILENITP